MMRSRGFTLVELLAVIVILAIILAIAIPNISNIIDSARLNSYLSNEKLMVGATKNFVVSNSDRLPVNIGQATTINLSELQTNELMPTIKDLKDGSITCDGYVLIRKGLNSAYNYEPYLKCGSNYESNGLIAWYSFENNANDMSLDAYNGTSTSVSYIQDFASKSGSFDGSTSLITVSNFYNPASSNPVFLGTAPSSSGNFNGNATYTVWVKPTTLDTTCRNVIADSNYNEGIICLKNSSIGGGLPYAVANYNVTVQANTWYYVVMSHERDNANDLFKTKLYVNGIPVSTYASPISVSNITYGPDGNLSIGNNWIGLIDDLRIYNKVLTDTEVLKNYNNEKVSFGL